MEPSTLSGKAQRRLLPVLLLISIMWIVAACFSPEPGILATCEPRNTTAPGRLNIAVVPSDDYGITPPCQTNLDLYIAQNTPLRSLDGVIELSTPGRDVLTKESVSVELKPADFGTLIAQVNINAAADQNCRSLTANLNIQHCWGAGGDRIECPEIRVKPLLMCADFSVSGENLDVCYDE
jgi:hypothetical protein